MDMASDIEQNQLTADALEERAPAWQVWRRRLLLWLLPLVVVGVGVWLYGTAGRYVSTDNAYVQQDRVDVAPQVAGNVVKVFVGENARVAAGDPVLGLDDTVPRIAVAAAEAKLASARAEVESLKAAWHEKLGEMAVAKRASEFSMRDLRRQQQLAAAKLIPASQLDTTERSADIAVGAVGVLQLQLSQTVARLGGNPNLPTDQYAEVRAALSDLARARVDLEHTRVPAPQAGIVSHLPKIGGRVDIGRPAFAIVTSQAPWVEANFKETDLEYVRPGQDVRVDVDTYGHHQWHGRIESIAQATGAEFSLLPAQNASGNWVKVVQRIPLRIALIPGHDDPPLRDGMSANVEIDTGPHTRFDQWFGRDR
jgi:membrane fusion protein (multidrug efflux system)